MKEAAISLALFAAALQGEFRPAEWELRRPLGVGPPRQVHVLAVEPAIRAQARQDLSDLRVVWQGQEIPYVLETMQGSASENELFPEVLNKAIVPGVGLQATLDLRETMIRHSRLRIFTSETNFRRRVRIETSDDAEYWAVAREEAWFYRHEKNGRPVSVLETDYPLSTRRFVRLTLFGWSDPASLREVRLAFPTKTEPVWNTVARVDLSGSGQSAEGTTTHLIDGGEPIAPYSRLRAQISDPAFHRAVELEASSDRDQWRPVASGHLSRDPAGESLTLSFPERRDRYLRLRIRNGDDQPLDVRGAELEAFERRLKFIPKSAGDYRLYYKNPTAKAPVYDLGILLARWEAAQGEPVQPGAEEKNPAYQPGSREPWSERHPELLYTVLGAAVLGMGYVTIRFMLKMRRAA